MGLFSKCSGCGKKKLFFSIGFDGLCSDCHVMMWQERGKEITRGDSKQNSQKNDEVTFEKPNLPKTYRSEVSVKEGSSSTEKKAPVAPADAHHPLYGRKIVFAGKLSISRKEAVQMATAAGAIIRSELSGKTDYLVLGEGVTSSQEDKIDDLLLDGNTKLQVICEREFINLLQRKDRFSVDVSDGTDNL